MLLGSMAMGDVLPIALNVKGEEVEAPLVVPVVPPSKLNLHLE